MNIINNTNYFVIQLTLLVVSASCFLTCSPDEDPSPGIYQLSNLDSNITYNALLTELDNSLISRALEQPTASGALDRNREAYFHVRFQFGMNTITDYAVTHRSMEALSAFIRNLEFSFQHQLPAGDFEFSPPADLVNLPDYRPPSEGDLASGVAFFAYSLGMSLTTCTDSDWFVNATETQQQRMALNDFQTQIAGVLDYLKSKEQALWQVDALAPNRLLFNALAYYTLGQYLNNSEAMNIGIAFAESALEQTDVNAGYFIEANGWDSSYNGVALKIGLELFTSIQSTAHQELKAELGQKLMASAEWQASRILDTGEISAEGNTRVYPGGEAFLGTEKAIDATKTIKAFYYLAILSGNQGYQNLAEKVLDFYL